MKRHSDSIRGDEDFNCLGGLYQKQFFAIWLPHAAGGGLFHDSIKYSTIEYGGRSPVVHDGLRALIG